MTYWIVPSSGAAWTMGRNHNDKTDAPLLLIGHWTMTPINRMWHQVSSPLHASPASQNRPLSPLGRLLILQPFLRFVKRRITGDRIEGSGHVLHSQVGAGNIMLLWEFVSGKTSGFRENKHTKSKLSNQKGLREKNKMFMFAYVCFHGRSKRIQNRLKHCVDSANVRCIFLHSIWFLTLFVPFASGTKVSVISILWSWKTGLRTPGTRVTRNGRNCLLSKVESPNELCQRNWCADGLWQLSSPWLNLEHLKTLRTWRNAIWWNLVCYPTLGNTVHVIHVGHIDCSHSLPCI